MKWTRAFFERFLILALTFLIPAQLAYHFWPSWAFVYGIRVDYLAPAIYLTDIFAILLILTNLKAYKKYIRLILVVLAFAALNTLFSTAPIVSIFKWAKIVELVLLALYFMEQKLVKGEVIYKTLFYSAIFFSIIGIAQFIKGGTLGGIFYYLGERSFNSSTPGIALVELSGRSFLRAYSTFSHPNSFAGFLGVVIILSFATRLKKKFFYPGLFVILTAFILTFSLSSFLAVGIVGLLFLTHRFKKYLWKLSVLIFGEAVVVSLILPVLSKKILNAIPTLPQNIIQRLDLSYISGQMIGERFLVGEGLNTFIINITRLKGIFSHSWLLQPVHNIFLLVLSETGILGLLALSLLIYKSMLKALQNSHTEILLAILFLVIGGVFDHYTVSLQQNLILFSILSALALR